MNAGPHVLITGGAGYIGSLLASELLRTGARVTVIDSLLFGGESILPLLTHPSFRFVKADVTEPRAVKDDRGLERRSRSERPLCRPYWPPEGSAPRSRLDMPG